MPLTGAQGTSADSSASIQAAVVRVRVTASIFGTSTVPVPHPKRVGREQGIAEELRRFGNRAEALELAVVVGGDDDESVEGREHLVGYRVGVGGAQTHGNPAANEVVGRDIGEPRHLDVEQSEVHVLAFPGEVAVAHRREQRHRRVHAGHDVVDRDWNLAWRTVGLSGDADESAHSLGHHVVARTVSVWSGLPESGD